jgi:hypothetical protein
MTTTRLALVAMITLAACQQKKARVQPPPAEDVVRGKTLVGTLKKNLRVSLEQALPHGAASALAACHTLAPSLASSLATEGILVGRATRLPRNPKNAAEGWTADALTRFEKMKSDGRDLTGASYARRLPDGRTAYAEPIVIQDVCLACHGAEVAPDVKAAIAATYPADRATGYAVGDLRGLAWVELPARSGAAAR